MLISHRGLRREGRGPLSQQKPRRGGGKGDVLVTGRGEQESHQLASHTPKKLTHILRLTDIHVMNVRQTDRQTGTWFTSRQLSRVNSTTTRVAERRLTFENLTELSSQLPLIVHVQCFYLHPPHGCIQPTMMQQHMTDHTPSYRNNPFTDTPQHACTIPTHVCSHTHNT